jgi:hypothetical protein
MNLVRQESARASYLDVSVSGWGGARRGGGVCGSGGNTHLHHIVRICSIALSCTTDNPSASHRGPIASNFSNSHHTSSSRDMFPSFQIHDPRRLQVGDRPGDLPRPSSSSRSKLNSCRAPYKKTCAVARQFAGILCSREPRVALKRNYILNAHNMPPVRSPCIV